MSRFPDHYESILRRPDPPAPPHIRSSQRLSSARKTEKISVFYPGGTNSRRKPAQQSDLPLNPRPGHYFFPAHTTPHFPQDPKIPAKSAKSIPSIFPYPFPKIFPKTSKTPESPLSRPRVPKRPSIPASSRSLQNSPSSQPRRQKPQSSPTAAKPPPYHPIHSAHSVHSKPSKFPILPPSPRSSGSST